MACFLWLFAVVGESGLFAIRRQSIMIRFVKKTALLLADGGCIPAIWRDGIQCGHKRCIGRDTAVFDIGSVEADILCKAAGIKAKALRAAIGHIAVRVPPLGCKTGEPSACQE